MASGLMKSVTVKAHERKLEMPVSQLPTVIAMVSLLNELSKSNPLSGMRLLGSLYHTMRALDAKEVKMNDNDEEYVSGLHILFDFYFDHFGNWETIEKVLRSTPLVDDPVFNEIYETNRNRLRIAAEQLAKQDSTPIERLKVSKR